MKDFELLKRTYPISQHERNCDGWDYIASNSTVEDRMAWKISLKELPKTIEKGEKYIYQVAKEDSEFKIMTICYRNYAIIRKYIFGIDDDE